MLQRLKEFRKEFKHCRVPNRYERDRKLGLWVTYQRRARLLGKISDERKAALEKLGFEWQLRGKAKQQKGQSVVAVEQNDRDSNWISVFKRLKAYLSTHGHCNVPYQYAPDQELGDFVSYQRRMYWDGKLSKKRKAALDDLGFDWAFNSERENAAVHSTSSEAGDRDELWNSMLKKLKFYQKRHGDCNVPRRYTPNTKLGRWVEVQRRKYRDGSLSPERMAMLDRIGFECGLVQAASWDSWVEKLKKFKRKHGHCVVPYNYRPDPPLGNWTKRQRDNYFKNNLSDDRTKVLNRLGFVWDPSGKRSG